jgi:hypothetical protein
VRRAVALILSLAVALLDLSRGSRAAGRGTVDGLVDRIVEQLRPAIDPARDLDVGVAVLGSVPRLNDDLEGLLCGRLGALGVRSTGHAEPDLSRAAADGWERIVRLEVRVAPGHVQLEGSVTALEGGLWGGAPEQRAHLYATASIDGELRAYLSRSGGAVPPRAVSGGLPIGDLELLALGVGPLRDPKKREAPAVVAVTADELVTWEWDGGGLKERERLRFEGRPPALRPRAQVASLRIAGGAVIAHASGFAEGVKRAAGRSEPARGYAFPGFEGACELEPGVDWFTAQSCGAEASGLPERFWSAAIYRGGGRVVRAAVDPLGVAWVKGAGPTGDPPLKVSGVGAQIALAALERGEVLVTTEAVVPGEPDAVVLRALKPGLPVIERIDRLPGGVVALAAGDIDGDGRGEIVVAVRDRAHARTELWIVE